MSRLLLSCNVALQLTNADILTCRRFSHNHYSQHATADNVSDLLTKPLGLGTYRKSRSALLSETSNKIETEVTAALKDHVYGSLKNMKMRLTMSGI